MLAMSYLNTLQSASDDSGKDIISLIRQSLYIFVLLLIIDLVLIYYAVDGAYRCYSQGRITGAVFIAILAIIFILPFIFPSLGLLSFLTTIGIIVYARNTCSAPLKMRFYL
jgi:hypothetical protein